MDALGVEAPDVLFVDHAAYAYFIDESGAVWLVAPSTGEVSPTREDNHSIYYTSTDCSTGGHVFQHSGGPMLAPRWTFTLPDGTTRIRTDDAQITSATVCSSQTYAGGGACGTVSPCAVYNNNLSSLDQTEVVPVPTLPYSTPLHPELR